MDTIVKIFDYKMHVDRGSEGEKLNNHHLGLKCNSYRQLQ